MTVWASSTRAVSSLPSGMSLFCLNSTTQVRKRSQNVRQVWGDENWRFTLFDLFDYRGSLDARVVICRPQHAPINFAHTWPRRAHLIEGLSVTKDCLGNYFSSYESFRLAGILDFPFWFSHFSVSGSSVPEVGKCLMRWSRCHATDISTRKGVVHFYVAATLRFHTLAQSVVGGSLCLVGIRLPLPFLPFGPPPKPLLSDSCQLSPASSRPTQQSQ